MHKHDDFDWLLEQEIPHLRRYAMALCGHDAEADDLVQDCLERALRKRCLWLRQGRLRSWLFRMLYRIYLNRRRDQRHERAHLSLDGLALEPAQAATQLPYAECLDMLLALRHLPEEQRSAILLIALEDLSYEEAAWVLRVPIGTLRSRIARGRAVLRSLCEPSVQATAPVVLRRVK
ncbi:MAG: sigma-70 family RNA polymerase sigma factor [Pseudomonadota bacterium]|nr:sigma-70 family RNA polymerase sigma factor [Pseudomonadota bacterium]